MKRLLLLVAATLSLVVLAAPPMLGYAATTKDALCEGVGTIGGPGGCADDPGQTSIDKTIKLAVNVVSTLVGVASIIMIMIGGFKYVTSGGDSSKVSSAKDTVLYAVVGLAIVALAQVIVRFVVSRIG
jgi:hypothetical protein